ncbi:hypothetical protein J6590_076242 [Homalodisca vitripennis]|nr:hypothetical protein J6590_076242 [Homalodisca vitripennis]
MSILSQRLGLVHESALNHRRARECNAYWTRKLAINLSSQMDDFNKSVHPLRAVKQGICKTSCGTSYFLDCGERQAIFEEGLRNKNLLNWNLR